VLYVIIYSACIWVLVHRKRQAYIWHIVSSTISFALVSIQIILLVTLLAANMVLAKDATDTIFFVTLDPNIMQEVFDMAIFISL
jgi:hypothetical protein